MVVEDGTCRQGSIFAKDCARLHDPAGDRNLRRAARCDRRRDLVPQRLAAELKLARTDLFRSQDEFIEDAYDAQGRKMGYVRPARP